jgi:hypothetical protein
VEKTAPASCRPISRCRWKAYANLRTALEAIGAKPNQVTKLTTLVVDHDMSKLGVKNVKEMFGETLPAQTLIPVPRGGGPIVGTLKVRGKFSPAPDLSGFYSAAS